MRKTIALMIGLLIAGAIVNVAVAWGIALQSTLSIAAPFSYGTAASFRGYAVIRSSPGYVHSFMANGGFGEQLVWCLVEPHNAQGVRYFEDVENLLDQGQPKLALPYWAESAVSIPAVGSERAAGFAVAQGWPLLSLHAVFHHEDFDVETIVFEDFVIAPWTGIVIGSPPGFISPPRALSVCPIWPGVAFNTIFYAAVLWVFWATPFALRRRRRIKRGLCPACAYPVGTSPVCTECGQALPIDQRMATIKHAS